MILTLRVLHLNDTHSHLDPAVRVKTIIQAARRVDPEVLVLHAGDAMVGTPWYEVGGKGRLDFQVLEAFDIDAYTVGNHDLDGGVRNLTSALGSRQIPLTVANWQIKGDLRRRVKPFRLRSVRGQTVAIVGLSVDPRYLALDEVAPDPDKTFLPALQVIRLEAVQFLAERVGQKLIQVLPSKFRWKKGG